MDEFNREQGLSTLVNHVGEGQHAMYAHVSPIYQTSTFGFPDVDTGAAIFKKEAPGYVYTRWDNPNQSQLADKIAALEGIDLLRAHPGQPTAEIVAALVFGSGMAAISAGILARVKSGGTIIAQKSIYGATYNFLQDMVPEYGIQVVWVNDPKPEAWEEAFQAHPGATLAYAESPSNPVLALVDLAAAAEIAHRHGAWLMVDNTFASPYCQRPLTLGADIVVHSTTKYLSGHGQVIGGAVVSSHPDFMQKNVFGMIKLLGGVASPFDCWLTSMGLRTLELRMQRHCENALQVARYLETHPKVERVYYPGLEGFPEHELAKRQMLAYGGMISFELKGGLEAGKALMNHVKMMTLAVSLGNVDTLIQHPASMTQSSVDRPTRLKTGITDGLVRLSVGVENIADILADFDQALDFIKD